VKELLRTNDQVLLSWTEALLKDANIPTYLLDSHTSVVEGSIGALPRRLMIDDGDDVKAKEILESAGIRVTSSRPAGPFIK